MHSFHTYLRFSLILFIFAIFSLSRAQSIDSEVHALRTRATAHAGYASPRHKFVVLANVAPNEACSAYSSLCEASA
jgi:hypothetical protein